MFVIFTYVIMGIFAPLIAPHGEAEVIASAFAPRDENMLLGADQLGRDIFSRIIYGTRNSVGLALAATIAAFILGALAGLLAATKGGWFDQFMGRLADVIMSIPSLIFALLMLSIFGPDISVIIVAVAIIYAPRVFRLTRAVAGNIVVMDYIEAAKLRGEGTWYLIRREILPNSTAPLIAEFGLEFCFVFLLVAGLSFLGLGIQPPTADWGSMVRENATLISFGDITPLIPAAAIALLTVRSTSWSTGCCGGPPASRRITDEEVQERISCWRSRPPDPGLHRRNWVDIIKGVDLTLHRGEVLGLIGESGAGKSTIGAAAMGYARDGTRISGGSIEFDGMELTTASGSRKAQPARVAHRLCGAVGGGVVQPGAQDHRPAHRGAGAVPLQKAAGGAGRRDASLREAAIAQPRRDRIPLSAPGFGRAACSGR